MGDGPGVYGVLFFEQKLLLPAAAAPGSRQTVFAFGEFVLVQGNPCRHPAECDPSARRTIRCPVASFPRESDAVRPGKTRGPRNPGGRTVSPSNGRKRIAGAAALSRRSSGK